MAAPVDGPIPDKVYFLKDNDGFNYDDGEEANGWNFLGRDFRAKWYHRRKEFPNMTPANNYFPY